MIDPTDYVGKVVICEWYDGDRLVSLTVTDASPRTTMSAAMWRRLAYCGPRWVTITDALLRIAADNMIVVYKVVDVDEATGARFLAWA